jgi:hypothetical protein
MSRIPVHARPVLFDHAGALCPVAQTRTAFRRPCPKYDLAALFDPARIFVKLGGGDQQARREAARPKPGRPNRSAKNNPRAQRSPPFSHLSPRPCRSHCYHFSLARAPRRTSIPYMRPYSGLSAEGAHSLTFCCSSTPSFGCRGPGSEGLLHLRRAAPPSPSSAAEEDHSSSPPPRSLSSQSRPMSELYIIRRGLGVSHLHHCSLFTERHLSLNPSEAKRVSRTVGQLFPPLIPRTAPKVPPTRPARQAS